MNRPVSTFHIKRRNFKTKPFHIRLEMDGWPIGSIWSRIARLQHYPDGQWVLRDSNLDFHLHADQLVFDEEAK